jgi:ribosomal protein S12 methylthiotransferase accessory factor
MLDDLGVEVWQCTRPLGRSLKTSQGKGTSARLALISAALEAYETYCAEEVPADVISTVSDVGARSVGEVAPEVRTKLATLPEDRPIAWCVGRGILTGREFVVPWDLVSLDLSIRDTFDIRSFDVKSTGLGAGRTYEAAAEHACGEYLEDFALKMPFSSRTVERVDPGSVPDGHLKTWLGHADASGMEVSILRIIGVASAFVHVITVVADGFGRPAMGVAASSDPLRSMERAFAEAAQSRVAFISGARDDIGDVAVRRRSRLPSFPIVQAEPSSPPPKMAPLVEVFDRTFRREPVAVHLNPGHEGDVIVLKVV